MVVFLCPRPLALPPVERFAADGWKSSSTWSSLSLWLLSLAFCLAGPRPRHCLPLAAATGDGLLRLATEGSSSRAACLFLPPCTDQREQVTGSCTAPLLPSPPSSCSLQTPSAAASRGSQHASASGWTVAFVNGQTTKSVKSVRNRMREPVWLGYREETEWPLLHCQ